MDMKFFVNIDVLVEQNISPIRWTTLASFWEKAYSDLLRLANQFLDTMYQKLGILR